MMIKIFSCILKFSWEFFLVLLETKVDIPDDGYEEYAPRSRTSITDENGSTQILHGSSMGVEIDDYHTKY